MNLAELRKLGSIEKFLTSNFQLTFSFKIVSQIGILDKKLLVYDSLNEWKLLNPLLRCKIAKNDANELAFEFIQDSLDNIEFIQDESSNWNSLIQNQLNNEINVFESLLWTIKFIKLVDLNDEYLIIFTTNHSIIDGRSGYIIVLELLKIIQNKFDENFKKQKPKIVLNSVENLIFNKYTKDEIIYYQPPAHKAPSFLTLSNMHSSKITSFLRFRLESDEFNKLISQCKKYNTKLTSCLNLIWTFAFKMLYLKYDLANLTQEISFTNSISLRKFHDEFRNNEAENHIMGYYINNLNETFYEEINFESDDWIKKFWYLSSVYSIRLHDRLNKGEQFKASMLVRKTEKDEFNLHFGLSNMGRVPPSLLCENSKINVNECFVHLKLNPDFKGRWFMSHYFTINNVLFGSLSYNSNVIPAHIIEEIYDNFKFIARKII